MIRHAAVIAINLRAGFQASGFSAVGACQATLCEAALAPRGAVRRNPWKRRADLSLHLYVTQLRREFYVFAEQRCSQRGAVRILDARVISARRQMSTVT